MSTSVALPDPTTPPTSPVQDIANDLPAANADGTRLLLDRYGRTARDLRVSLTDKCNLRCTYCMPAEGLQWMHNSAVLTDDEVIRLVRIAVEKLGVRKLRFTGGEPLLRKSLPSIIERSKALTTDTGDAPEIALTTNGLGLDKRVASLSAAGLDRINISLDTIDKAKYTALTRRDRLDHVLRSIDKCAEAGLSPIKINALVMKGVNEDDVVDLAAFALDKGAAAIYRADAARTTRGLVPGRYDHRRRNTSEAAIVVYYDTGKTTTRFCPCCFMGCVEKCRS